MEIAVEDLLSGGALVLLSAWCLRPILELSAINSDDPLSPIPKSYKTIAFSTILVPLVGGLLAHRAGESSLAAALFMTHLGALFACAGADPTHTTREEGEPLFRYAARFLVERVRRSIRPKMAAIVAALSIPFLIPNTHWAFAGMAASIGMIFGKGVRVLAAVRPRVDEALFEAEEKRYMNLTLESLAKTHLLAMGPVLYLFNAKVLAPEWSALAGYTLFAAAVALVSLYFGAGSGEA
jgi:hypothetical protein